MPEHAHEQRQGATGGLRTPPVKDDVLPPTPEDVWRENLATIAAAMNAGVRPA